MKMPPWCTGTVHSKLRTSRGRVRFLPGVPNLCSCSSNDRAAISKIVCYGFESHQGRQNYCINMATIYFDRWVAGDGIARIVEGRDLKPDSWNHIWVPFLVSTSDVGISIDEFENRIRKVIEDIGWEYHGWKNGDVRCYDADQINHRITFCKKPRTEFSEIKPGVFYYIPIYNPQRDKKKML